MILGIQWLAEVGDIMWNFNRLQMKFTKGGQKCLLLGEKEQGIKFISQANMHKLFAKKA